MRCRLSVLNCAVIATLVLAGLTGAAEAKPTGWQSESEIRKAGASAWAGYGDSGYVARPKSSRSTKAAKAPCARCAIFLSIAFRLIIIYKASRLADRRFQVAKLFY